MKFALRVMPAGNFHDHPWGKPHVPLAHTVELFAVPLWEERRYLPLLLAFANVLEDGKTFAA